MPIELGLKLNHFGMAIGNRRNKTKKKKRMDPTNRVHVLVHVTWMHEDSERYTNVSARIEIISHASGWPNSLDLNVCAAACRIWSHVTSTDFHGSVWVQTWLAHPEKNRPKVPNLHCSRKQNESTLISWTVLEYVQSCKLRKEENKTNQNKKKMTWLCSHALPWQCWFSRDG